ncbi:MAG: endolytic transglycosylase MltG [Clostridia bacterium]|nr:endolytic transglycosylase MltG [Clostridia bacterium]
MENQNIFDINEINRRRAERERKRKRRNIITAVILLVLAGIIGIVCYSSFSGVKADGTVVEIEVVEGSTATAIANSLEEAGLIKSTKRFLKDLNKSEYAKSLRFGVYEIKKGMTHEEIILLLSKGGNLKNGVTVTIPEGYSLERIVERIAEAGLSNESELMAALNADYNYDFLNEIPPDDGIKHRLQGFLFPSTYQFSKDMTAEEMINMMLAEFSRQIKNAGISTSDVYETVTLASLVEREAKVAGERARIAGVIKNRIEKGMRLQIDASVVYAISDGMYNVDRVLYRDLEVDSPYNTYKYSGLPIGPICSPGIDSIIAAANPEKHNYYYYRTDNEKADGSHIFTENFEEHKASAN